MSFVMQADASVADAWASKDLGVPQSEVWVTFDLAFRNAAHAFWAHEGSGKFLTVEDVPLSELDILFIDTALFWNTAFISGGVPKPTAQIWHRVEYHYKAADSTDLYIDDTLLGSGPAGSDLIEFVRMGQIDTPTYDPAGVAYIRRVQVGTTRGSQDLFADDFSSGDLSNWDIVDGDASVIADPELVPNTQVFGGTRFYEAPTWRQIVTDLDSRTLTFLDRLGLDRSITVTRAATRIQTVRVPSDSPEVNIPAPDPDSPPFVSEGTRFLYSFRREAPGDGAAPWVVRAAGIVLEVDDEADSDHATSIVTAYDPWKYLYRRPVLLADGSLPGDAGRVYPAGTTADEIIIEQLSIAEAIGGTVFTDYASTGFYAGTIETTDPLPDDGDGLAITFARGVTLGEMLDTLVATGTCDVVFDPIYDPVNRPGILSDLSIYRKAGQFRPNAIFGWDKWPRNVVQLSRQIDGTGRANRIQMFAGQGGPPVPEQSDAASIAEFGEYWALQYLPGVPSIGAAKTIAQRQLALLKNGAYTYALSPAAERAPLLFQEYREADTLPLHASRRFRDPIVGVPLRVESIPIVIGDDQLERVNQMLVSFAPETGS